MKDIASLLRDRRRSSGLTQSALARKLGVSPTTLSRWERGREVPSSRSHRAIGRFLRMPESDLREVLARSARGRRRPPPQKTTEERLAELEERVDSLVGNLSDLFDHVYVDGDTIVLDAGHRRLEIDDTSIRIEDSAGHRVKLDASGITLESSSNVIIEATKLEVAASTFDNDAAITNMPNTSKCGAIFADAVVAKSYGPAAGNIW